MAKSKRHFISFEVTAAEEQILEQRAKHQGVNRSQYLRGCLYFDFFMSGDSDVYRFLGSVVRAEMKEAIASKVQEWRRRGDLPELPA